MIYFRDHHWLPVQGYTRFDALIQTDDKKKDDVFWMLDFRCVAGGAQWRRVRHWERPSLWLQLSSIKPKLRDWRDLEHLDFWNWEQEEDEPLSLFGPGGVLNVDFYPKCGSQEREHSFLNDAIWRVAAREDGMFTVELAAFADGRSLFEQLTAQEVKVTPDGRAERDEPDADFWKKNAELYLVENIPFGTVTVRAPRNVSDPETYALRRARALIGIGEPEHVNVTDHLKAGERIRQKCPDNIRQDIFVELHFNGFYED
ncbi:MAG TPA: hypothetical protein VIK35_01580 [Verrucomicrobiae bacterium]